MPRISALISAIAVSFFIESPAVVYFYRSAAPCVASLSGWAQSGSLRTRILPLRLLCLQ